MKSTLLLFKGSQPRGSGILRGRAVSGCAGGGEPGQGDGDWGFFATLGRGEYVGFVLTACHKNANQYVNPY